MATHKEAQSKYMDTDGYFGCCPVCNLTLVQAKNGMDGFIKCPRCATYVHVVIKDGTVITKKKITPSEE